jgi:hypothetical protein
MAFQGGGWQGAPVLGRLPEAERRGTHFERSSITLVTSEERRVSPMKWRLNALHIKVVYVLLVLASLVAVAGADIKWH